MDPFAVVGIAFDFWVGDADVGLGTLDVVVDPFAVVGIAFDFWVGDADVGLDALDVVVDLFAVEPGIVFDSWVERADVGLDELEDATESFVLRSVNVVADAVYPFMDGFGVVVVVLDIILDPFMKRSVVVVLFSLEDFDVGPGT